MRAAPILAGPLALGAGTVALVAAKGGRLHQRSGKVFVGALLFMSASGALLAALQPEVVGVNVVAASLVAAADAMGRAAGTPD